MVGQQSNACDMCGCAWGNNYTGIMPKYHKNFVGVQYYHHSFRTSELPSLLNPNKEKDYENGDVFSSYRLYGRYYLLPRLQLFAFVPYQMHAVTDKANNTERYGGLGDIQVSANYILLNTGDSADTKFKQTLGIGGGVKAPTGRFRNETGQEMLSPSLQIGTGAWDFNFSANYTLRYEKVGVNLSGSYGISGENEYEYRYGNKWNGDMRFFIWKNVRSVSFLPNVGLTMQNADKDRYYGITKNLTGGESVLFHFGTEMYYKSIACNFNAGIPIQQNLAEGYVKSLPEFLVSVQYLINNKKK